MKNSFILLAFLCLLSPISPAAAQEEDANKDIMAEKTVMKDKYAGQYQTANMENISKLYWMKDAVSLDDDIAIDNFILINDCDIYKKYKKDDFKWLEVRDAARAMIKHQLPTYSDKFKIVLPIDLGRYDMERKGFPLINDTAFKDLKRIAVSGNNYDICGNDWVIEKYPRSIFLRPAQPFSFGFLKMDEHTAQAFIVNYKKKSFPTIKGISAYRYNRLAFIRVRMRFMQYEKAVSQRHRTPAAIMLGRIDGIEIFKNADETGLMASIDYYTDDL